MTLCGRHAVNIAVITGKIDVIIPTGQGQPHRALSIKRPYFLAAVRIDSHHLVPLVITNIKRVSHNNRLEHLVILHQVAVKRVIPHLLPGRIKAGP